jgi:hypothetical protein
MLYAVNGLQQEPVTAAEIDDERKDEMPVTDNELIERAAGLGIIISPAAVAADARKLLLRSGIHTPTALQQATAERGAIEAFLFEAKRSRKEES